ncbi:hypothetical protein POM88_016399 [Heracleum sosnowskyi]|uniref:Uncharacterized protein n=1 Tax=Heracleum sosnowskyi TaxID=360622 RepID=A0AAD8IMI6_9APIA|nr:hypothetical protein POM88_016399 [Heracleum sosnowskyi]
MTGGSLSHSSAKLFLAWTGWVCVWTAILLFLLAILGACSIINSDPVLEKKKLKTKFLIAPKEPTFGHFDRDWPTTEVNVLEMGILSANYIAISFIDRSDRDHASFKNPPIKLDIHNKVLRDIEDDAASTDSDEPTIP